ncbi:MAG: PIN domain-containing protein [Spirochaetota bacterium]
MRVFLVDTSAWIRHFSRGDPFDLRAICEPDDRVLCLPIYHELLQGVRDERRFRELRGILRAASFVEVPVRAELYDEAIDLYRLARKNGLTIRSSVDCLIAACAIRQDLIVIHSDRDYPAIARVSALEQRQV